MLLIFAHEFLINWDLFIFDQCKNQWTGWWSLFFGFFFTDCCIWERDRDPTGTADEGDWTSGGKKRWSCKSSCKLFTGAVSEPAGSVHEWVCINTGLYHTRALHAHFLCVDLNTLFQLYSDVWMLSLPPYARWRQTMPVCAVRSAILQTFMDQPSKKPRNRQAEIIFMIKSSNMIQLYQQMSLDFFW